MGNIEVLAESVKAEGLINPPTVTPLEDGTYRVVAGRRRIAAVRLLKWKDAPVRVINEADAGRLETIGLAENVNRQDTHPLDEAETFKKLLDKGTAVEDIAAYFDRSVAGIHHRIRLCGLAGGVKEMFREGKITLSGAALIASLPGADQEKFHKKHGGKGANRWEIAEFIRKTQRLTLEHIADDECGACRNRTHNAGPGLFDDEYPSLKEVCFDEECYAKKWRSLIRHYIAESGDETKTEHKIILNRGIPEFVSGKTAVIDLEGEEYTSLNPDKRAWSDTNKKNKANTAWLVSVGMEHKLEIKRVSYKKRDSPASGGCAPSDPFKDLIDQIPGVREEDREAVVKKVKEKSRGNHWALRNEVKERLLDAIIAKRLEEGSGENLAALYLTRRCSGEDAEGNWREIDDEELFAALFGPEAIAGYKDIPMEPLIQKLFFYLIADGVHARDLPDPDDFKPDWNGEWDDLDTALFWKFAQVSREEYAALYKEQLAQAVREAAGEEFVKRGANPQSQATPFEYLRFEEGAPEGGEGYGEE
jgi:ParB/RepB/Spo0J family partition protein